MASTKDTTPSDEGGGGQILEGGITTTGVGGGEGTLEVTDSDLVGPGGEGRNSTEMTINEAQGESMMETTSEIVSGTDGEGGMEVVCEIGAGGGGKDCGVSSNGGVLTTLADQQDVADGQSRGEKAPAGELEEEEGGVDRPTIFVRNFADIAEPDSSDDDDSIVILDMEKDVADLKRSATVNVSPRPRPPPRTLISQDVELADLDMTCESPVDMNTSKTNAARFAEHQKTKIGFLKIRMALLNIKDATSRRADQLLQSRIEQTQSRTTQAQPMTNGAPAIPRMPNANNAIRSNNASATACGTRAPVTATGTNDNNQPTVNFGQISQILLDPSQRLILQPIPGSVVPIQLRAGQSRIAPPPASTIRIHNGMIFSGSHPGGAAIPGNQLLNGQQAMPPHHLGQTQGLAASTARPNNSMPVCRILQQQAQRGPRPPPIRQVAPARPVRQVAPPPVQQTIRQVASSAPQQLQQRLPIPLRRVGRPPLPPRPPAPLPTTTQVASNSGPRLTSKRLPVPVPVPIKHKVPVVPSASGPTKGNTLEGVTAGNQKPIPGSIEENDKDSKNNKTFPSLVVPVKIVLHPTLNHATRTKFRADLDSSVRAVMVHSPATFCEWLLRRGLLRLKHLCDDQAHRLDPSAYQLGMFREEDKEPFSGGYVWTSPCCPDKHISVFAGSIFEGSKYPPGTLLKLIYHWTCQTPVCNILAWVPVKSTFLKEFFASLRAVCTTWLHEKGPLLGGERKFIEIGVITLGSTAETSGGVKKSVSVEILGVFDPAAQVIRFKVINDLQSLLKGELKEKKPDATFERGARACQILWALAHWVDKRSILVVDGLIDKALFTELGFQNVLQCKEGVLLSMNHGPTNSNVMNYLRQVVPKMFSTTLSVLSKSIVQQFLDELSWREMFSGNVLQCYENMLDHIGGITKLNVGDSLISRLNKTGHNPTLDWSFTKQVTRSPHNVIPDSLRNDPGIWECMRRLTRLMRDAAPPVPPHDVPVVTLSPTPLTKPDEQALPAVTRTTMPSSGAAKRKLFGAGKLAANASYYTSYLSTVPRKELSLQNFYYGRIEGGSETPWSQTVFNQKLKCPLCIRGFLSNREIMRHLMVHAASLDRNSENRVCNYCLKVESGLEQHIRDTHKLAGTKFGCRICQIPFSNEEELTVHMWHFHVEAEGPYRCEVCSYSSSFHYEVVDHFYQAHARIGFVMCPHCLKVLCAQISGNVQEIIIHLHSHQPRRTKKCDRCVLSFEKETELMHHLRAHLSRTRDGSLWLRYEASESENILMAIPPTSRLPSVKSLMSSAPPPPKRPRLHADKKTAAASPPQQDSSLNVSCAVPIDTNERYVGSKYKINLPITEEGKAICAECLKDVATPNHYIGRLQCTKCRYVTACQAAIELHHQKSHLSDSSRMKPGMEKTNSAGMLAEPLVCQCGFMSLHPFKLAEHIVNCGKRTLYPLIEAPLAGEAMETEEEATKSILVEPGASPPATSSPSASSSVRLVASSSDGDLGDEAGSPSGVPAPSGESSTEVALLSSHLAVSPRIDNETGSHPETN